MTKPEPWPSCGYETIEEVEGHHARSDIDYRADVLAIDGDVVLLFGVERLAAGGFGDLDVLRMADPVGGVETSVAIGGEVEEGGRQNDGENKRTRKSHLD